MAKHRVEWPLLTMPITRVCFIQLFALWKYVSCNSICTKKVFEDFASTDIKREKGGKSKVGNPHQIFTHSEVNQIKEWFPKNCKLAFLFSKYNNMWSKKCAHPTPPRTPPPENLYLRAAGYQTRPHLRWQLTVQNLTWHFTVNKYLTKSQIGNES